MKKLRNRLIEQGYSIPEVIEYIRINGRFPGMKKFNIKTYHPAYTRFLKEETGDENFGISPINRPTQGFRTTDIQLDFELTNLPLALKNLARAQAEVNRKLKRIEELKQKYFLEQLELEEAREHKEELVLI